MKPAKNIPKNSIDKFTIELFQQKQCLVFRAKFLPMLLLAREIVFKAFGPFKEVDGTVVKLFRATFSSCNKKKIRNS